MATSDIPPDPVAMAPEVDLRDSLRPLWTRKWLILGIVVVCTVVTYLVVASKPKQFEATTKIYFQDSSVASILNTSAQQDPDRNLQNQITLLESQAVAAAVARQYGGDPGALSRSMSATAEANSDFVLVTDKQRSPQAAARYANAFAAVFIRLRTQQLQSAIQRQLAQINTQLRELGSSPSNAGERSDLAASARDLRLAQSLPSAAGQQVDPAFPIPNAVSPRPKRAAIFALLLSLVGAVTLAFLLERLDRRLRRLTDVEDAFGVPLLAAIPQASEPCAMQDGASILSDELREPFRTLRTNIDLAAIDRALCTILVTSAGPSVGKSTVVRNLALAFGESGRRVAVVDMDFRRPSVARLFHVEGTTGLVHVLTGTVPVTEAMQPVATAVATATRMANVPAGELAMSAEPSQKGSPGLRVIGSGPIPADPQAVLASRRAQEVLAEIAEHNDVVLIDAPPLLAVSDVLPMLGKVDGVLLVARLGETTRQETKEVLGLVGRLPGVNLVGVIANGVDSGHLTYEYGY